MAMLAIGATVAAGQAPRAPALGAQIWIEPGQTDAEIDAWFHELSTAGMPVARLFMMWAYLEPSPDRWDFSLYDAAFRSAEKYHVHIVATLTPTGPPPFLGGDGNQGVGVIVDEARRAAAADYMTRVVERYRGSPALDTWLLLNEPGQAPLETPDTVRAFQHWLQPRYGSIGKLNLAWGSAYADFSAVSAPTAAKSWNHNPELDWREFWTGYQTTELRWLAQQVRRSDAKHPLHLNPAGIFNNLAKLSDNLPAWREFLDTLGCSIHPAWHFSLITPERYELGVYFLNDMVRGSIEPKPYWVTELQGGTNINSASQPMEPTANDTAQWVWTSVGAGAQRVIFWLLNARRAGVEAGEWSMLDFQQRPGRNLLAAANITRVIAAHQDFFAGAKPVESPVTIILSLETMNFEAVYHHNDDAARDSDAHFFEALGFYKALSTFGPPPRVKHFDDYDWTATTPQRRIAILPDVRELTGPQTRVLEQFVEHGNTLLISGLTGFYGPHALAMPLAGFPLGAVTGGDLKEMHLSRTAPSVVLDQPELRLPSRMWLGSIEPHGSVAKARNGAEITATERVLPGGGRVLWIPSPIGMGAWFEQSKPLAVYLKEAVLAGAAGVPFALDQSGDGCLLRVLKHGNRFVTVLANGSSTSSACTLTAPATLSATTLWGKAREITGARSTLEPHETFVQFWQ